MKNQRFVFNVILFAVLAVASQASARSLPSKGGGEIQRDQTQEQEINYLPIVSFPFGGRWVKFVEFWCRADCLEEDSGSCIGGAQPRTRFRIDGELHAVDIAFSIIRIAIWNAEHEDTPRRLYASAFRVNKDGEPDTPFIVKKDWLPEERFGPPPSTNQANPAIFVEIRGAPRDAKRQNLPNQSQPSRNVNLFFGPTYPTATRGSPEGSNPVFSGATVRFDWP